MSRKLLFSIAIVALLSACTSRAAVVYGDRGASGASGGGGTVQTTSNDESSTFVVTDDMPEECQELTQECQTCDEVEMTRRRILKKKCVRVCEAYVDAGPAFAENVAPAIDEVLRQPGVCGKTETTCSAIERSQCAHAMDYTSVGRPFLINWVNSADVPPAADLLTSYYDGFLKPVDALHRKVFEWGRVNETDVTPLMEANARILALRITTIQQEVLGEASSQLPPAGESTEGDRVRRLYKNAKSLADAVMAPGGSLETYRNDWDVANESFLMARSGDKSSAE